MKTPDTEIAELLDQLTNTYKRIISNLEAENAKLKTRIQELEKDNDDILYDFNKSEQCCGELLEENEWLRERVPSECYEDGGDDPYADHFIKGLDG